jgi:hypothetical protein
MVVFALFSSSLWAKWHLYIYIYIDEQNDRALEVMRSLLRNTGFSFDHCNLDYFKNPSSTQIGL